MTGFITRQNSLCSLLTALLVLGVMSPVSWAAETKNEDQAKKKEETPVTRLDQATDLMTKDLDENQLLQFRAIEQTYRTIRAVEDVQMSVGKAVSSCSEANPDIADDMTGRLRSWKDALRPTMKSARKKLDKMILLQGFTQPSSVRKYLKMFDEAVDYRDAGIKAIPVTEKESCMKLKKNMDQTEKSLNSLLNETLGLDEPIKTSDS
ncbi:MAG: hypothetical protein PHX61_11350 [Alphaproteobacteria bacterium]|nr:hypothetical protein [Alphaproteobacteria bacterium]